MTAQVLGFLLPTWETQMELVLGSWFGLAQSWMLQAFGELISGWKIPLSVSVSLPPLPLLNKNQGLHGEASCLGCCHLKNSNRGLKRGIFSEKERMQMERFLMGTIKTKQVCPWMSRSLNFAIPLPSDRWRSKE